jgi:hypothetical protein
MTMTVFPSDAVSFHQLLGKILGNERRVQVEFLIALAEFDRQELYLRLGYSTIWEYCMKELHLCKGSTYKRTHAAALIRRFPQAAEVLRERKLCMTTLVELEEVLTAENFDAVVAQAAYKTKDEVQQLKAAMKVPSEMPREHERRAPKRTIPAPAAQELPMAAPFPIATVEAPRHIRFEPVSADDWFMHARLSDRVMAKMRRARELASHKNPMGQWEAVLEAMADCFIELEEKRRAAKTDKPKTKNKPSSDPHYVPAEVQRIVWERDGGCCTWIGDDGHRCESRWQVEFDHIDPHGPSTAANVRLLCRPHNRLHAEQCYGKEHMDQFRRVSSPGAPGGTHVTEVTPAPLSASSTVTSSRQRAPEDLQSQLELDCTQ